MKNKSTSETVSETPESSQKIPVISTTPASQSREQTGHTPAPWDYHVQSNTINGGGLTVAIMSEINWQNERLRPQVEADAHLIAAAPELLEVLKDLIDNECPLNPSAAWETAEAVIAKAEGK